MKIMINKNILDKTKKCKNKFCCLKSQEDIYEIKKCILETVYFINPKEKPDCHYVRDFRGAYYCTCPVRTVIYNKYRQMEINMERIYGTIIKNQKTLS